MAPLNFAANISFLFGEHGHLPDRYAAAKRAGFRAVECGLPYAHSAEELGRARELADVQHVLLNTPAGPAADEDAGLAALPCHEKAFLDALDTAVVYAKRLDCSRIHITSGRAGSVITDDAMGFTYRDNLAVAAHKLKEERMVGLIQPISASSMPRYYMSNLDEAVQIIENINSPHLRLLLDVYHLQILSGNLTSKIRRVMPLIGHVQIAQVPDRHEPNSLGEINFRYLFDLFEELGYSNWIGCEYTPRKTTEEGLTWVHELAQML